MLSRDGGLVILHVNASRHRGTFYCTTPADNTAEWADNTAADTTIARRIIAEHEVNTTGQSVMLNNNNNNNNNNNDRLTAFDPGQPG